MAIIPLIVVGTSTALADTKSDCLQSETIELKLTACTRLIDGRELAGHDLAVAYYNRGIAYRNKANFDQAIADYDKSVTLDPQFAPAYSDRGFAYVQRLEFERIMADLTKASDPARKVAPADGNPGKAYWDNEDFDRAIADFTRAIDLDPKAVAAYRGRCVVLATANRNLQLALSDCEQAVRLLPATAAFPIETRGLVHLRLNRLDEALADYNASLRIDADSAFSLYGRGIVKQKKGDRAGADADFAAAKAIKPDIAEEFARFGIN